MQVQPSTLILLAAGVGLLVNTLAIVVLGVKGGVVFGGLQKAVETLTGEIARLRDWRHDLGNIDQRVTGCERDIHDTDERVAQLQAGYAQLQAEADVRSQRRG